jgi:hypothetical protein
MAGRSRPATGSRSSRRNAASRRAITAIRRPNDRCTACSSPPARRYAAASSYRRSRIFICTSSCAGFSGSSRPRTMGIGNGPSSSFQITRHPCLKEHHGDIEIHRGMRQHVPLHRRPRAQLGGRGGLGVVLALRCTRATALNKDLPHVPHALQVVLLAQGQRDAGVSKRNLHGPLRLYGVPSS